jgi:uncharacterized protein YodC (DUF2158 family)
MPIGTRVRLASGGPIMLVVSNDGPHRDIVTCGWRADDGSAQEDDFVIVCLDVVRDPTLIIHD